MQRFLMEASDRDVDGTLDDLFALVASASFPHSADASDRRFCAFRAICGNVARVSERAAAKPRRGRRGRPARTRALDPAERRVTPAPARGPALPDAEARESIRHELDRTLLVEAGAGSGKTTMLVERMLALLLSGKARPENVAAVTFTRKAASHLRRKFQAALEEAAANEKAAARKAAAEEARASLDRLTIGTIDAFCALLLGERPLEAGIDPAALKVEMQAAALFRERAFREFIAEHADSGGPVAALFALGVRMKELEDNFELFADYPDVVPVVADPLALPDFKDIRRKMEDFLRRVIPLVPRGSRRFGSRRPAGAAAGGEGSAPASRFRHAARIGPPSKYLRPAGGVTQYKWPDKGDEAARPGIRGSSPESRQARARRMAARPPRDGSTPCFAPPSRTSPRGARDAGRSRTRTFSSRRAISSGTTRRAARVRGAVHAPPRRRVPGHGPAAGRDPALPLGDETPREGLCRASSPGRARSSSSATRSSPSTASAARTSRRTWRFRRALTASGGRIVELNANFAPSRPHEGGERGLPGSPPGGGRRTAGEVRPARAGAPDPGPGGGAFRLPSNPDRNPRGRRALRPTWAVDQMARRVRRSRARRALRRLPRPDADARPPRRLRARARGVGAPVDVSGSRSLPISRGLQELRPLLAAVQDPDDSVSVAAFLSGPLCGVDDDALFRYRRPADGSPTSSPPPEGDPRLAGGLALLAESRKDVRALPAGAALGRIVRTAGRGRSARRRPRRPDREREPAEGPRARAAHVGRAGWRSATSSSASARTRPRSTSRR